MLSHLADTGEGSLSGQRLPPIPEPVCRWSGHRAAIEPKVDNVVPAPFVPYRPHCALLVQCLL